jgi:hypothetical protein
LAEVENLIEMQDEYRTWLGAEQAPSSWIRRLEIGGQTILRIGVVETALHGTPKL